MDVPALRFNPLIHEAVFINEEFAANLPYIPAQTIGFTVKEKVSKGSLGKSRIAFRQSFDGFPVFSFVVIEFG